MKINGMAFDQWVKIIQKDAGSHFAEEVLDEMLATCPVKTGLLRSSLQVDDSDPENVRVGSPGADFDPELTYAEEVEERLGFMRASLDRVASRNR